VADLVPAPRLLAEAAHKLARRLHRVHQEEIGRQHERHGRVRYIPTPYDRDRTTTACTVTLTKAGRA
jgi:hypothetical protein